MFSVDLNTIEINKSDILCILIKVIENHFIMDINSNSTREKEKILSKIDFNHEGILETFLNKDFLLELIEEQVQNMLQERLEEIGKIYKSDYNDEVEGTFDEETWKTILDNYRNNYDDNLIYLNNDEDEMIVKNIEEVFTTYIDK